MPAIPLTETSLIALKKSLRADLPDCKSSHLCEAMAAALGFRTYAALRTEVSSFEGDPPIQLLDGVRFESRLNDLGYELASDDFRFEWLSDCPALIETTPDSAYDITYNSKRSKAWRNLMVLAINEGIRLKLFSLRPGDNRWPGATTQMSVARSQGYEYDFTLPDGKPARGYVSDAGFNELTVRAVVFPKGKGVRVIGTGFDAGDAIGQCWLEREKGAYLQSSTSFFQCRKYLLEDLIRLEATPLGYGDRGRVIL